MRHLSHLRHLSHHATENTGPILTILSLDQYFETSDDVFQSEVIQDGIFWSSDLENRIKFGPSDGQVQMQLQELRFRTVEKLEKPDWLHCGHEQNRFVQFKDGSKACARFRSNHVEFVQGEVMAFYLARLLGITNTPAVVLSKVRSMIDRARSASYD